MGFESRAISARVTKQIVTIFSKTCDKRSYHILLTILPAITQRLYMRYYVSRPKVISPPGLITGNHVF